jgi:2-polyprenyl-3-methyl-5-hydroxy-6-metoxy-1,4-benzoquinol methylase
MGVTWEAVSQSVRSWLPFTALNTVWRHLDRRAKAVLDVGCGKVALWLSWEGGHS